MEKIFISYARADDEPFVKKLYADLSRRHFEVWWDRAAMESWGRTFLQEIHDAITAVDRLILVVAPEAVPSDYVRAEWALALQACKVIVPILRRGDYDLIPAPLGPLHCPDLRPSRPYDEALAELVRVLQRPLGRTHGLDALPEPYLPRPEQLDALKVWALEFRAASVAAAVPSRRVEVTGDGQWAVAGEGEDIVEIWELETGRPWPVSARHDSLEQAVRSAWRAHRKRIEEATTFLLGQSGACRDRSACLGQPGGAGQEPGSGG